MNDKNNRNTKQVLGVVLPENTIVKEVLDDRTGSPFFLVSTKKGVERVEEWLSGDSTRYIPMDNEYISNSTIRLPVISKEEDIASFSLAIGDLHRRVMDHIHKYVDIHEADEYLVAAYVIHTWVFDRYDKVPYLRFIGVPGSGKSRMLRVLSGVCYHPIMLNGNISDAGIFRTLELNGHGTFLFDEMNLFHSSRTSGIVKVLNSGYEKDNSITRCEGISYSPRLFNAFGPKIIAQNQPFDDNALESRLLSIHMQSTSRQDISDQLSTGEYKKEVRDLQKLLLAFRFKHYFSIDTDRKYPELEKYSHRFRERYNPILRTLGLNSVPDEIIKLAEDDYQAYYDTFAFSPEGIVVAALSERIEQGTDQVYPGEIAAIVTRNGYEMSPRAVGQILRVLGVRGIKRNSRGIQFDLRGVSKDTLYKNSGLSI